MKSTAAVRGRSGTQSIERAFKLMKELAARGSFGWRLSDLSAKFELDTGTAHRILSCLVRERIVERRSSDRRYFLGPLAYELGLSLPTLEVFRSSCRGPVAGLADRLGCAASLYLRSGTDVVCAVRMGIPRTNAILSRVGTRRPMMMSAAGVAVLIALRKDEANAIVAENSKRLARLGTERLRSLRNMIQASRERGFGINEGQVTAGVSSFGVAIRDAQKVPFASVTIAGPTSDFPPARLAQVLSALKAEAAQIEIEAVRIPSAACAAACE